MTWRTEWWKITVAEQNIQKRIQRNQDSLRDLWDNIKHINICIIGLPEEKKDKKKDLRKYLKTVAENVWNMGKEKINQVQ